MVSSETMVLATISSEIAVQTVLENATVKGHLGLVLNYVGDVIAAIKIIVSVSSRS